MGMGNHIYEVEFNTFRAVMKVSRPHQITKPPS